MPTRHARRDEGVAVGYKVGRGVSAADNKLGVIGMESLKL